MSTLWFDLSYTYTLVHHYSSSSCNKTSLKKKLPHLRINTRSINCSPPAPTQERSPPPNPSSVTLQPQSQNRLKSSSCPTWALRKVAQLSSSDVKRVSCTLIMLPGRRRSKVTLWEQVQPMHFAQSGWRGDELRERERERGGEIIQSRTCMSTGRCYARARVFSFRAACDSVRGNRSE